MTEVTVPDRTKSFFVSLVADNYKENQIPQIGVSDILTSIKNGLCDPDVLGIPESNWIELSSSSPNAYNAMLAVKRAQDLLSGADLIFFYYCGHAWVDSRGLRLFLKETELNDLEQTTLPFLELNEKIKSFTARRVVTILDCCYGAAGFQISDFHRAANGWSTAANAQSGSAIIGAAPKNAEAHLTREESRSGALRPAFSQILNTVFVDGIRAQAPTLTISDIVTYMSDVAAAKQLPRPSAARAGDIDAFPIIGNKWFALVTKNPGVADLVKRYDRAAYVADQLRLNLMEIIGQHMDEIAKCEAELKTSRANLMSASNQRESQRKQIEELSSKNRELEAQNYNVDKKGKRSARNGRIAAIILLTLTCFIGLEYLNFIDYL